MKNLIKSDLRNIDSFEIMNNFPKGINKIIEEYCCYQPPYELELLRKTIDILGDTNEIWMYDRHHKLVGYLNVGYIVGNTYGIIRRNHIWKFGFKNF